MAFACRHVASWRYAAVEDQLINKLNPDWNSRYSTGLTGKTFGGPVLSNHPNSKQSGQREMFYVYENWQAGPRKAVIHHASCGYCNDGEGKAGGYDPRHAQWHGPYNTIDQARSASQALPGVVVRRECRCVLAA